jgi:hypothetical protein
VAKAELGTHSATERAGLETLRLNAGAPQLYPDPTGKENSESILASSLAGGIARCSLKRRQRGAADKAANLAG